MFGDGVAMRGTTAQRAQDQQTQRALEQFYSGRRLSAHCVETLLRIA